MDLAKFNSNIGCVGLSVKNGLNFQGHYGLEKPGVGNGNLHGPLPVSQVSYKYLFQKENVKYYLLKHP